jgi:hypothetical protein
MSLVINSNLMAINATRETSNSFASLASSRQRTANDTDLRQITRAEIKPLNSGETQPMGESQEAGIVSGAQGDSTATNETQTEPMALERQTGTLLNTTDRLSEFAKAGLDSSRADRHRLLNTSDAGAGGSGGAAANQAASAQAARQALLEAGGPQNDNATVSSAALAEQNYAPIARGQSLLGGGLQQATEMGLFTHSDQSILNLFK